MTEGKPVKQVIIIRKDLKMRRGKEIAQGSHAAMAWLSLRLRAGKVDKTKYAYHILLNDAEQAWINGGFRKVVCQVSSLEALMAIHEAAQEAGLESRVITDAGLTEFGKIPTVTALAVGPDYDERIDPVTGELELY